MGSLPMKRADDNIYFFSLIFFESISYDPESFQHQKLFMQGIKVKASTPQTAIAFIENQPIEI